MVPGLGEHHRELPRRLVGAHVLVPERVTDQDAGAPGGRRLRRMMHTEQLLTRRAEEERVHDAGAIRYRSRSREVNRATRRSNGGGWRPRACTWPRAAGGCWRRC